MAKFAVIQTGGKQYLVKENDELIVEKLDGKDKGKLDLVKLAEFDDEKLSVELGFPELKNKVEVEVLSQIKGDKIRVAKFKAKVRYRKVMGFRPKLTKIKIAKI